MSLEPSEYVWKTIISVSRNIFSLALNKYVYINFVISKISGAGTRLFWGKQGPASALPMCMKTIIAYYDESFIYLEI